MNRILRPGAPALLIAIALAACNGSPVSQTRQSPAAQTTNRTQATAGAGAECDVLTKADAEKVLGTAVGEGQEALGTCTYAATTGVATVTVAVIRHPDASTARTAFDRGLEVAGSTTGGTEPAEGLGDAAAYLVGGSQLWVLEGEALLQVTVIGPQDARAATRAAAEIALGRI